MHGNRVARKRIHHQQIEPLWCCAGQFALERQSGVARHYGHMRRGILDECEEWGFPVGDVDDFGINLVIADTIACSGISRHGTDAHADDAEVQAFVSRRCRSRWSDQPGCRQPDAARAGVVRSGPRSMGEVIELHAMRGRSVHQFSDLGAPDVNGQHSYYAVEVTSGMQNVSARGPNPLCQRKSEQPYKSTTVRRGHIDDSGDARFPERSANEPLRAAPLTTKATVQPFSGATRGAPETDTSIGSGWQGTGRLSRPSQRAIDLHVKWRASVDRPGPADHDPSRPQSPVGIPRNLKKREVRPDQRRCRRERHR